MAPTPTTNLEDTMLVAYMVLKGHKIKPWRDVENGDHITFDIEGDVAKIEADMQTYYANEQVGIADFVRHFKAVKSQMYAMKKATV